MLVPGRPVISYLGCLVPALKPGGERFHPFGQAFERIGDGRIGFGLDRAADAILCPFAGEQAVDMDDRPFDLAAKRLVDLAERDQFAIVPRRAPRLFRSRLDPGQRPLDPADRLHRQFICHRPAIA